MKDSDQYLVFPNPSPESLPQLLESGSQ